MIDVLVTATVVGLTFAAFILLVTLFSKDLPNQPDYLDDKDWT